MKSFLLPELAAGETEPARAGFRRSKREPHGEHDHHFDHRSDHQGHPNCWCCPLQVRDVGDRQRRLKPITPTKPSTLSFRWFSICHDLRPDFPLFRQSSLNGPPSSYAIFPNQPYQMPKVISKYPVCHLKLTITTLYHLPWKWSQVKKWLED